MENVHAGVFKLQSHKTEGGVRAEGTGVLEVVTVKIDYDV